jgi:hypothetical protein
MSVLRNGNFEADWSEEESHRCQVFPVGGQPFEKDIGNIFNPPGWRVWFRHEEGVWAQPEARDARATDPPRMRSGVKGFLLFTFFRKHDAGLTQQIAVQRGARLRFSVWAHAWSNHKAPMDPDKFPHPDDPRWSEGAGFAPFFALEGTVTDDNLRNFTFWVGIDPTGGTDPFAASVAWGKGAHIYNAFDEVPAVETVAQSETVTLFTRSRTLWAFKHNDAYWDDATLTVGEPLHEFEPSTRGKPRIQYERVYVLLPQGAGREWAQAVVEATWDTRGYTIGRSADDAGIGDLDRRVVIAINPAHWGPGEDGTGLQGFFQKYYPGVEYRAITAATPEQLKQLL